MTDQPLVLVPDVPCFHGGEHPGGHVVSLKAKLGLAGVIVARRRVFAAPPDEDEITAVLLESYVRHGVAKIDGKIVDADELEALLQAPESALPVADKASELYEAVVLGPLVTAVNESSPDSQTEPSTSATSDGSPKPPKRSKPSSTSTSPTDSTEPTPAAP